MKHRAVLALIAALLGASCADSPSGPDGARLAMAAAAGNGQEALAGAEVAVAPTVVVRGSAGRPLADVAVAFTVTRGGGSVAAAQVRTDAAGIASAGSWTLGPEPGENEVQAAAGMAAPVSFTATGTASAPGAPAPAGTYQIEIRWLGTASVRQQAAVSAAVARWRTIVVRDVADIPLDAPAGACFATQPALSGWIDDLLIFVEFEDIDGPGNVLGQAGPCYVRMESGLPVMGFLKLDGGDLELMEQSGTLDDVVLHEIGHILGIGTLWSASGMLLGSGGSDPVFTGAGALAAYHALGGAGSGVPVENTGATGSRDGHWRESAFRNELMTPLISGVPNPLSALTIASLADLGYGATSSAASAYVLGDTRGLITASIDLRGRERLHGPKFKVDRYGRKQKL
jgi:hypothetical protein